MAFVATDAIITRWATEHALQVSGDMPGRPVRSMNLTGTGRECFQIFIDPAGGEALSIHACSVETDDDAEFHETWRSEPAELVATLDLALQRIEVWKARSRTPTWW